MCEGNVCARLRRCKELAGCPEWLPSHNVEREFGAEMLQVSLVLPSTLDTNPQAMGKRLREQVVPLFRLYLHMEESKSVTQFSGGAKAGVEKTQKEEDDKNNLQDAALKGKLDEVEAGDVTSSISDFGTMTVQEKKSLVSKLNKDDRWANCRDPA